MTLLFYSGIFLAFALWLFAGFLQKRDLGDLSRRVIMGVWALAAAASFQVWSMDASLDAEGKRFVASYSCDAGERQSVRVGTDPSDDIRLYNRFSVPHHLRFDLAANEVLLLTKRRSLLVNDRAVSFKKAIYPHKSSVKSGDYVKIGYAWYRLFYDDKTVRLETVFWPKNVGEFLKIYDGAFVPDMTVVPAGEELPGVETRSVGGFFGLLIGLIVFTAINLTLLLGTLSRHTYVGEKRFLLYPLLFFALMIGYFYFASFINFIVLEFFQTIYFQKGAVYTAASIGLMMNLSALLFYLIAWTMRFKTAAVLTLIYMTVVAAALISQRLDMRTLFELAVLLLLFPVTALIMNLLRERPRSLMLNAIDVNPRFVQSLYGLAFVFSLTVLGLALVRFIHEGSGTTFLEIGKIVLLLSVTMLMLTPFRLALLQNKSTLFIGGILVILPLGMLAGTIVIIKDTGSILQLLLALGLIGLFYYDYLDKHFLRRIPLKAKVLTVLAAASVLVGAWYKLQENARIKIWLDPYASAGSGEFEHIVKGLLLIRDADWWPLAYEQVQMVAIPAMHTDYVVGVFANVFGLTAIVATVVGLLLFVFSYFAAISVFENHEKNDLFQLFFALNGVFVAYFTSYVLINLSAIIQLIPLTDVPIAFLTFARGMLMLFLLLYGVILFLNERLLSEVKA